MRDRSSTTAPISYEPAETLRVGTLNLRNTSDRWRQRWPLMRDQLIGLQPDVLGLQELRRPSLQPSMIVRGLNRARDPRSSSFRLYPVYKTGLRQFWEGIAILTRAPVVSRDWLDLGSGNRVAQRVTVRVLGERELDVYNTHLDHAAGNDDVRLTQAERLLAWISGRDGRAAVLVGDFNSQPDDPAIAAIGARFTSAYAATHGTEPQLTVPTVLSRTWGKEEKVLDYIFVNDHVQVHDAWITFDDVDEDRRLAASDHFGIAATISLT